MGPAHSLLLLGSDKLVGLARAAQGEPSPGAAAAESKLRGKLEASFWLRGVQVRGGSGQACMHLGVGWGGGGG